MNSVALFYGGCMVTHIDHAEALMQRGESAKAYSLCQEILAQNDLAPEIRAKALFFMGTVHVQNDELDLGIQHLEQTTALAPHDWAFLNNLAVAYRRADRCEDAVRVYQTLLQYHPHHFDAHFYIGHVSEILGQLQDALHHFSQALHLDPENGGAYLGVAITLYRMGYADRALAYGQRAVTFDPESASAFRVLGIILCALGQTDNALSHLTKAASLDETLPQLFRDLGNIYMDHKRYAEALENYEKEIALTGDIYCVAHALHITHHFCDWSRTEKYKSLLDKVDNQTKGATACFPLMTLDLKPVQLLEHARRLAQYLEKDAEPQRVHHAIRGTEERLKIGYLSCDYHDHATAFLIAELFEVHDRERFEVFLYSYGKRPQTPIRQRIVNAGDHFIDIDDMSDADAAQKIAKDGIDILIDLKGYTGGARFGIPARRPAPIQVAYLGYPGTTGSSCMDYLIADPFIIPEETRPCYSEKIAYLPDTYQVNCSSRPALTTRSRAEYGLPEHGFVFCAFNAPYKITSNMFDVWLSFLGQIEGSVLWLLELNDESTANLKTYAKTKGIDPERLIFAPHLPFTDHLARYCVADLFLDTHPCGGHTTASDALWAGLPLVTLVGDTFQSRVAGSLLFVQGLDDLITYSLEDYQAKVLELTHNPNVLALIRQRVAASRTAGPLFDTLRFTRNLEAAYQTMAARYRTGLPPETFFVGRPMNSRQSAHPRKPVKGRKSSTQRS